MTAPTTLSVAAPAAAKATPDRVADHIRAAAETTGVPFEFLLAQANQESRLDPEARSRRSSAMGLFQFTRSTWLEMVKKHGAEHGMEEYADAIRWENGAWTVKDKALKREILDLRRDPEASALMAGEYAKDNETVLQARLGRSVSAHDLYLAHFLGAGGAARVIEGAEDRPQHSAARALPDAARANPEVFREPGSRRSRSFSSLYDSLQNRFDKAVATVTPMARRVRPEIDLAALRPPARPAPAVEAPAAQSVQIADAPAALPSEFAKAVDSPSPYFPVALPPPAQGALRAAEGGPVLRLLIQAMESGKA